MKKTKKQINEEEKLKKEREENNERQAKYAIIIMGVLIIAFIGSFYGVRFLIEQANQFEYMGIKFVKDTKLGGFWGIFPIKDIYGKIVSDVKVKFWENPKNLARINITDKIVLTSKAGFDLETINSQGECEDAQIAGQTLLLFMTHQNLFGITPFRVTINKTIAQELQIQYIDCSITERSIIVLEKGNESIIKKEGNCYIIQAGNNCEILNATERFILQAYNDAVKS